MDLSHPEAALQGGATPQENVPRSAATPQQQAPQPPGPSQQQETVQPSKDTQPEGSPKGEQGSIKSWAAVEGEMKKEDEATMKGHMEDVDYLLVFAGLFSAVLTAFVVESYQQLQPDHQETSSKLLRRISIQLESFTLTPSFANSTHPVPALPSLDFRADAIARWINILWFLSLIFSLAAALFGILVKQWIREYMKWNSALAHPRDNVLVRQIRFEAWNDWNVPTTIAAVPALLEIALVFFVCGLVILLWTLDPVVSIVITTAAAVFLAIAATFTFLPAFFRRCPYKSPTAWAFAIFWDFFTLYIPHKILLPLQLSLGYWIYQTWVFKRPGQLGKWLMTSSGLNFGHPRIGNWTAFAHDWRSRDLANLWSSLWPGAKRGNAVPLLEDLRLERKRQQTDFLVPVWLRSHLPTLLHNAQRTITELSPLVRALAWVSQASQDAQTQAHVISCIESLETRFTLPHDLSTDEDFISDFFDEDGVRAVSYWNLALDLLRSNAHSIGQNPVAEERRNMGTLLAKFKPVKEPERVHWTVSLDGNSPEVLAFAHLLALSVRTLIKALSNPLVSLDAFNHLLHQNILRLRQYLAVLRYLYWSCNYPMPNVGDHLYDTVVETVNQESRSQMSLFPDWQRTMLEIIYVHYSPKLKKLLDDLEIDGRPDYPNNVAKIRKALLSGRTNTSHSQDVQPRTATQNSREANRFGRADQPTGGALQSPPIDTILRSASSRSSHRSASFPPAAQDSPQSSSHHQSLALPGSPHLLACASNNSGRSEASEGGKLSRPSLVLVDDEQNILNDVAGISSSQLGSREPASSTTISSRAHAHTEGASQPNPSSSPTVGPSFPPPPHNMSGEGVTTEEEQGTAGDPTPTSPRIPARTHSGEDEHIGPTDEPAYDTLEPASIGIPHERVPSPEPSSSRTAGLLPSSTSPSPLLVSIESPDGYGSILGGSDLQGAGESGDCLYAQPENEEPSASIVSVDEEQKAASEPASSSPSSQPSSSSSGGDDWARPTDLAAGSPLGSPLDVVELDPMRPPRPSSSYNAGPAPLHSPPTVSITFPPRRDGVFDDTEPGSAGEGGSRLEDREDRLPASEEEHVSTTDTAGEEV